MLYAPAAEREQSPPAIASTLFDAFHQWFEVRNANTPALREEVYRLRYQVYCCENQFENPDEHIQHLEMDGFDNRSIHSLIVERSSGSAIGTVRLILPDKANPNATLPIQQICSHPLPASLPLSSSAEISRFAISKKLKRMADGEIPKELKCSIVLGLMRAIVQVSLEYGITDWLAVMEPSLLRLLSRFGIYFTPLGPLISYHGMRQPCHASVDSMLERTRHTHFDLWEFVTESSDSWREEEAS